MKKITKTPLFILLLCFTMFSCSLARVNVVIDPVSSIVNTDKSKDELYIIANNWMVEAFGSAKLVIQFSDKEAGIVIGKYIFQRTYAYSGYTRVETRGVHAIIKIQVKDNAAKITIDPELYNNPKSTMNKAGKLTKEEALNKINTTINSFKAYVKNYSSNW